MAQSVEITRGEMVEFLENQGFKPVQVPGTKELVMGKVVSSNICLRIYTSIDGDTSRGNGEDAIRAVLVAKVNDAVVIVGVDKRVHRVVGWQNNLQKRIDGWSDQLGPVCEKCGAMTVKKVSHRGPFWGCCTYPTCKSIKPVVVARQTPVVSKPAIARRDWMDFDDSYMDID